MKKAINFKGGVRGKYAGKKLVILGPVATATAETTLLRKDQPFMVKIDEDVATVFKSPEAINEALRSLIQIMAITNR